MAFLLSGERPAVAAVTLNPLRAFGRWVARARAARAQRVALDALLEFDSHRLDDLGINRADLFHAMHNSPDRAGRELTARRAERARSWRRS
jgi:uncharacterized protein YjiS (DUF1127 family)